MVTDPVSSDDFTTTYFDTVDLRLATAESAVPDDQQAETGICASASDPRSSCRPTRSQDPTVPPELTELMRELGRDKDLVPVASVRTVRIERRLRRRRSHARGSVTTSTRAAVARGRGPISPTGLS